MPGQLNGPAGIAFDPEENLYVTDSLSHRVQKFTKDGKLLLEWGSYGDGVGEFNMPWGVAVDELGDVYVVDWRNDRVQKFNADGEFLFAFGKSGSGNGEFNRPAGIDVDQHGDIYVADRGNDRIQLFNAEGQICAEVPRRCDPLKSISGLHDDERQSKSDARHGGSWSHKNTCANRSPSQSATTV